jgi:hypothetical protein
MTYNIEYVGINFIKKDDEYTCIPFTIKNMLNIKINENGTLKFTLNQNSLVSIVKIYRKNHDKIKISLDNTEVELKCVKNEILKLVIKKINKKVPTVGLKNIIFKNNSEFFDVNNLNNIEKDIGQNIAERLSYECEPTIDIKTNLPIYFHNIVPKITQVATQNIIQDIKKEILDNNFIDIKDDKNNLTLKSGRELSFIIVTTQWGIKIAQSLKNMLDEINYNSKIIHNKIEDDILENNKQNPNEYFIILFSHLIKKMPEPNKYIIYQLEQKRQSKFINDKVLENISKSLITWDYSNENIIQFGETYKNKILFQPISIINKIQKNKLPVIYDILFFGVGCIRRNKILKYLKKQKYNIFITSSIFGDEMYKIISQSKIILNIHVYEDAILEIARINEVLPFNKLIISELPCESDYINKNFYQDKIIFCEVIKRNLSNIGNLTRLIDHYLKSENYNKFIFNNKLNVDDIYLYSIKHLKQNIKIIKDKNLNDERYIELVP